MKKSFNEWVGNTEPAIDTKKDNLPERILNWVNSVETVCGNDTLHFRGGKHWIVYVLSVDSDESHKKDIRVQTYKGYYSKTKREFSKLQLHLPSIDFGSLKRLKMYTDFDWGALRNYPMLDQGDRDDYHYDSKILLRGQQGAGTLYNIISTGRCFWQETDFGHRLAIGEEKEGRFEWVVQPDGRQSIGCIVDDREDLVIVPCSPHWYIDLKAMECGPIKTDVSHILQMQFLNSPTVTFKEAIALNEALQARYDLNIPLPKKHLSIIPQKAHVPTVVLEFYGLIFDSMDLFYFSNTEFYSKSTSLCKISFDYFGKRVDSRSSANLFYKQQGNEILEAKRDKEYELLVLQKLSKFGLTPLATKKLSREAQHIISRAIMVHAYQDKIGEFMISKSFNPTDSEASWEDGDFWEWFTQEILSTLRLDGYKIIICKTFAHEANVMRIGDTHKWYSNINETDSGAQWFDLDVGVQVEDRTISIIPVVINALKHFGAIEGEVPQANKNGEIIIDIPGQEGKIALPFKRFMQIYDFIKDIHSYNSCGDDGAVRLHRSDAGSVTDLESSLGSEIKLIGDQTLRVLSNKLNELKKYCKTTKVKLPKTLNANLRPYQKEGVNWLQFLGEYKLGGVLADDMGLGKTIQALTHLLIEKEHNRLNNPVCIICPTSVVHNWLLESEKFTPTLKVLKLHGNDRKKNFSEIKNYDIIVTSYSLVLQDFEELSQHHYHTIILDEAQYIKNHLAKTTQKILALNADTKICLTGTPLENHLLELWSLFNFAIPGYLGHKALFSKFYRAPIEKNKDVSRNKALIKRITPFMVRRSKDKVAKDLPEKTEIIKYIDLEDEQRDLYETVRASMDEKVRDMISAQGFEKSYIHLLDALLKLRQICCHPQLLKSTNASSIHKSAKLTILMEMLDEMLLEGRCILLFSQFTSMLKLIEERCDALEIKYVKIIGSTQNRGDVIEKFNNGEANLFLISLKAGGTGLNLTRADTVIHYDPWWNPAAEDQGTGRAHRIGQDKPVFVYKLITKKTIEEKILDLQKAKKDLLNRLLDPMQQKDSKFKAEDIQMLLSE